MIGSRTPGARVNLQIPNGTVLVGSDFHILPGKPSSAQWVFLQMIQAFRPDAVVLNGDVLDFPRISKHARIGWHKTPKPADEIASAQIYLAEIEDAVWRVMPSSQDASVCIKRARLIWPLGNHDARFETHLSNHVGEFSGVKGFTLKDHFPRWEPCWDCTVNNNTVIKHRWKGGKNATLNNVRDAGVNIVTGHLHSSKTSPYTDYRGTRFGVDCGTMADVYGPQFTAYTEDNPVDWRMGGVLLTFKDGRLLWPEHFNVIDPDHFEFRGEVFNIQR